MAKFPLGFAIFTAVFSAIAHMLFFLQATFPFVRVSAATHFNFYMPA
ncbi:MAG: hypothetical protein AAFQ40_02495 [Cyanobacteria bacterium J06623_5]